MSERVAIAEAVAERLQGRNKRPEKHGNISTLTDQGATRDLAAAKAGLGSGKTLARGVCSPLQSHLRGDHNDEGTLIQALMTTATATAAVADHMNVTSVERLQGGGVGQACANAVSIGMKNRLPLHQSFAM